MSRAAPIALAFAFLTIGCGGSVVERGGSTAGGDGGAGGRDLVPVLADRIDLLLAIDNSGFMADAQAVLALTIPDLVRGLTNPRCVAASGLPAPVQPASPFEPCAAGSERMFAPVLDIHMGVISSSLGGHGADACAPQMFSSNHNDDQGHLLARPLHPVDLPTYQDKQFLAWDPAATLSPPGEADVGALVTHLTEMVVGVDQIGCGFESQLESVYRFLVDTEPYASIAVPTSGPDMGKAIPSGVDTALLAQRADFLRPDSLLVVVMLSDENDCSIKESGQFYLAAQLGTPSGGNYHLPAARAVCADHPEDTCCRSCGQPAGDDEKGNPCPDDPTCKTLDAAADDMGLRCFDQKRRFGIDFLYPTDRYVDAFTSTMVPNRGGELVLNPIFSDLGLQPRPIRDAGLVFITGIVGVPWQDLARDPQDLGAGLKDAAAMSAVNAQGFSTWDVIVGDPASFVDPLDPHMKESIDPRTGVNPITGDPIAPSSAPNGENPINGHEYSTPARDGLQYACVFDLAEPRDCSTGLVYCHCYGATSDNPVCELDPRTGDATTQARGSANPGIRQLTVLRDLGEQGVVGSVCPKQVVDPSAPDFAYRPVVDALIGRLATRLAPGGA